jgi:hypothetical protein
MARSASFQSHFLQPRLAALPAEALQILAGRAERIGRALDEIAPAVAVEIDAMLEIVRRQELHLAELASPGSAHLGRRQVTTLNDAQRIEQFAAEHVGAAAVPRQGGEGAQRAVLAGVGAEIRLQSPKGDDGVSRDAILTLDALEGRRILLHQRSAALHAVRRHHAVGELQEGLAEHALAAILRHGCGIEAQAIEGGRDGGGRDALLGRVALEAFEESRKARGIAACGGDGRRRRKRKKQGGREPLRRARHRDP